MSNNIVVDLGPLLNVIPTERIYLNSNTPPFIISLCDIVVPFTRLPLRQGMMIFWDFCLFGLADVVEQVGYMMARLVAVGILPNHSGAEDWQLFVFGRRVCAHAVKLLLKALLAHWSGRKTVFWPLILPGRPRRHVQGWSAFCGTIWLFGWRVRRKTWSTDNITVF